MRDITLTGKIANMSSSKGLPFDLVANREKPVLRTKISGSWAHHTEEVGMCCVIDITKKKKKDSEPGRRSSFSSLATRARTYLDVVATLRYTLSRGWLIPSH